MGLIREAAEAAERTPEARNRYADFLRVAAIGAVVLGHWLVIDIDLADGAPSGSSVLATLRWAHWATWAFQVIPTFFLVGGYANSVSWRRHNGDEAGWGSWLRRRAVRLLWPTALFIGAVLLVIEVADATGVSEGVLAEAAWGVAFILWFLAAYLVVAGLTPVWVKLWDMWSWASVAVLIAGAIVVDWARFSVGLDQIGEVNHLFVWGAFHQVGVAWREGSWGVTPFAILGVLAGSVALTLATTDLYPVSMVTVPGAEVQNTNPPTVALLAYGLAQAGILLSLRPFIEPALHRSGVWRVVVTANAAVLSMFLWHVVPVILLAGILQVAGLTLPEPVGSAAWYAFRPVWVVILALLLAPIVSIAANVERPPAWLERLTERRPASGLESVMAAMGIAAGSAGLAMLALEGVRPAAGNPIPSLGLASFATGCALLVASAPRP